MLKKIILLGFILTYCIAAISCGKKVSSDRTNQTIAETVKQDEDQDSNSRTPLADKPQFIGWVALERILEGFKRKIY